MALEPGSKAGPYVIEEQLGRGGMASVYLAHDASLNRKVALKVLPREFLHDPDFIGRFRIEAQAVANLEHPNIIPIYGHGVDEDQGIPWMAMRYVPGGPLSALIKKEKPHARARGPDPARRGGRARLRARERRSSTATSSRRTSCSTRPAACTSPTSGS